MWSQGLPLSSSYLSSPRILASVIEGEQAKKFSIRAQAVELLLRIVVSELPWECTYVCHQSPYALSFSTSDEVQVKNRGSLAQCQWHNFEGAIHWQ